MNSENNELKNLKPQFFDVVEDKSIGLLGYMVVDSTVNGRSCGGLRMLPDVTLDELKGLARSMTLKYGFSGMAQGGAKAGIVSDIDTSPEEKIKLLKRFGNLIAPHLKSGHYITGPDMNTTQDEINVMLDSVGVKIPKRRRQKGIKSGFYTALEVMVAAEASAHALEVDLSNCTVAVEGFGSVGSSFAHLMDKKKGAKIIAVSTDEGGLYNAEGLDIDELLHLREKVGDHLVKIYEKAEKIEKEKLLTLDVDILSPCARHHSVNSSNVEGIKASVVCPGANIPVTHEAEKVLFDKGILSTPPFISNCGGVVGNRIEVVGLDESYIEDFLRRMSRDRILDLIKVARANNEPMIFIAERCVMKRFRRMKAAAEKQSIKNRFHALAIKAFNDGLIPEQITRRMAQVYFDRFLEKDKEIEWET